MSNILPSSAEARETLLKQAYARSVLEVLASRGYPARSEKEAMDLLELTSKVNALAPTKQASALYSEANVALDGLAGKPTKQAVDHESAMLKYAAALAADPAIYNAVLSLKAAEVAQ